MNLFWIVMLTGLSVIGGTGICFWLLTRAAEIDSSTWVLEHIICPIIRILVLLIIVSQVYPAIAENLNSLDFWRVLTHQKQFSNLLNILFFGSLALGFIPVANHPVFALPLQSCLAIALVFQWQYADYLGSLILFPSLATIAKITAYMLLAYFITRESSIPLSRWIDRRLTLSGSIRLVSDAIYLVLQIPVMLLYCSFLKQQLA